MGRFNGVMEFFLSILSVAVIAAGGVLIMRGELNTVDLITFSLYITTFVNPVRKLANFSELLANGTAGFSRASIDVQLRTSEHRSMYSYVRLSIIDVQLRTSEHRSMYSYYV